MFEDFLWEKFAEVDAEAKKQEGRAWDYMRLVYQANLEMHTAEKIFGLKIVSFLPYERKKVTFFDNPVANDANARTLVKRKSVYICCEGESVKSMRLLRTLGHEIKWITATLKRNTDMKVAWMLGIKDSIVVNEFDGMGATRWFGLVCGEVSEMMPKNLLPVPDALQT